MVSVASSPPITFEFHTFEVSTSKIVLQYQITSKILKTSLHRFKNYKNINYVENISFVNPFSWNHKFMLANICHYMWTIIVPKMFRVLVKIQNLLEEHLSLIPFDGPDFNSNQLGIGRHGIFAASSFQVLILYVNKQVDIGMVFANNILKDKVHNYHTKFKIKEGIKLKSEFLSCTHMSNTFCTLELFAPRNYFVNITVVLLKYSGPNIRYCTYGGLSIYDHITSTMKEVLLLCNSKITDAFNNLSKQYVVSSTQSSFLIFYAYWPYSEIKLNIIIEPTTCKGVHLLRYGFINIFNSLYLKGTLKYHSLCKICLHQITNLKLK